MLKLFMVMMLFVINCSSVYGSSHGENVKLKEEISRLKKENELLRNNCVTKADRTLPDDQINNATPLNPQVNSDFATTSTPLQNQTNRPNRLGRLMESVIPMPVYFAGWVAYRMITGKSEAK